MDLRGLVPKKHVFVENGELLVRANTLADHHLALEELKLLRREFRIHKRRSRYRLSEKYRC